MPWFDPELVEKAKEMDLFTYLSMYEPNELIHVSGNEYTTRTHDSLRISNGKWHWCSQGGGGKTAIQYLIRVRGMEFIPAVKLILSGIAVYPMEIEQAKAKRNTKPKSPFALPEEYPTTKRVRAYLLSRGIHANVIDSCIRAGTLYESAPYHNAVFVGKDTTKPLGVIWPDGRKFGVDSVLDIRKAASYRAGGTGVRYTCEICGKAVYLYDEEGRWFMESKKIEKG